VAFKMVGRKLCGYLLMLVTTSVWPPQVHQAYHLIKNSWCLKTWPIIFCGL
jgi:hypothetical protein